MIHNISQSCLAAVLFLKKLKLNETQMHILQTILMLCLPGCAFLRTPHTCRMQWESQSTSNMEKIKEAAIDGTCEGKDVHGWKVEDSEGFYSFSSR